ncbi:MAG: NADH-quinone oxidoreductase subunit M [Pirellulaceae bacterium]|jgi:NADH:ubiquinone oxidoreductase subunit 4 (subunit M)|nr:NADH-quinone oxidoreductase subunit M [Pirellulaceae bacterium]HJN11670.1 NADH-quinone oxidoreductase subunit M [Pirellulaceae bacterium]
MDASTLLLLSIITPMVGALLVAMPGTQRFARYIALAVTLITLAIVTCVVVAFPADGRTNGTFAATEVIWLGQGSGFDVRFSLALDGLGIWLYGLTALLMWTAVLVSWNAIGDRAALFFGMLMLLEAGCLGVFSARDIILFYVFFEFTLIPLFFLIGIWGSEDRRYAAIKFFLFTLAGSVLTFLGLLTLVFLGAHRAGTTGAWSNTPDRPLSFSIPYLTDELQNQYATVFESLDTDANARLSLSEVSAGKSSVRARRGALLFAKHAGIAEPKRNQQILQMRMNERTFLEIDESLEIDKGTARQVMQELDQTQISLDQFKRQDSGLRQVIFWALFIGFAIKVPLFPLHTWLPLAHVQAPTAGSVFLAGILLKIGTYGFVRFSIPMLPDAATAAMPILLWLAVLGIMYGALVALVQTDIKRLIAYSSVSHLGFCMLGLFAFNRMGLQGGTLQMISHGISTGALFALVGMMYERYHTREISQFGGLAKRAPWLAFLMLLFTFSSIGLPGLNGFVGEFMVLLSIFQRAWTGTPEDFKTSLMLVAVLAVTGVVLGAWYMLSLVKRVFFGEVREPTHMSTGEGTPHPPSGDLCWREVAALVPLAVFVVWIGVQPRFFLDRMQPTLNRVADVVAEPWPASAMPAAATTADTDATALEFASFVMPQSPTTNAYTREPLPRVR